MTTAFHLLRTGARHSGTPLTAMANAVIDGTLDAEGLRLTVGSGG